MKRAMGIALAALLLLTPGCASVGEDAKQPTGMEQQAGTVEMDDGLYANMANGLLGKLETGDTVDLTFIGLDRYMLVQAYEADYIEHTKAYYEERDMLVDRAISIQGDCAVLLVSSYSADVEDGLPYDIVVFNVFTGNYRIVRTAFDRMEVGTDVHMLLRDVTGDGMSDVIVYEETNRHDDDDEGDGDVALEIYRYDEDGFHPIFDNTRSGALPRFEGELVDGYKARVRQRETGMDATITLLVNGLRAQDLEIQRGKSSSSDDDADAGRAYERGRLVREEALSVLPYEWEDGTEYLSHDGSNTMLRLRCDIRYPACTHLCRGYIYLRYDAAADAMAVERSSLLLEACEGAGV